MKEDNGIQYMPNRKNQSNTMKIRKQKNSNKNETTLYLENVLETVRKKLRQTNS